MQALDAGRIDEDLEERPRQRHAGDLGAGELERDRLARAPIRSRLEEIGPDRGLHEVDEAPQDAVVVEAGDVRQSRLDLGTDRGLRRLAVVGDRRVEAGMKQGDDAGGERPVPAQGRGEVVLAVADAQLAQVAAERPQQRGVPPLHGGLQDETVVAVGFGSGFRERQQRPFERLLDLGQVDRHVAGPLQQHVVQPDLRLGLREQDAVGPLVDHPEAEVFQGRHPVGERQGGTPRKHLETGLRGQVGIASPEIGGAGIGIAQALQDRDIGHGDGGREVFAVADREGLGVAAGQSAPGPARPRLRQGLAQAVRPGAHDAGHPGLQGDGIALGRVLAREADDVVGPRQWAFGEIRVGRRQAPLVGLGEVGSDPRPHGRIVAVLGHVDEERDEAPEAVGPRQHADARPVGEVDDGEREAVQPLDVDLEQVVARIGLEHVQQRAPGMARRVEAGALRDLGDLAAQIRHLAGRGAVGGGGEQAEDAHLAGQRAVLREQLNGDVVEMDRAVDARAYAGLGDDERLRRVEEGGDLGRHVAQRLAQAQPGALRVAQEPQGRTAEIGRVSGPDALSLHPEQGEMPVAQPFEQGQSLGDLGLGQGQRGAPVALGEGVHQRQHGGKIVGGRDHVPIDLGEAVHEP